MNLKDNQYALDTCESRQRFIQEMESGIYTGTNELGEPVQIFLDKGIGFTVKVQHKEKPKWYECIHYDEFGFQEGVSYEPVEE